MLRPDGEIEREQRQEDLDPFRPCDGVEQPDVMRLCVERGGYCRDLEREVTVTRGEQAHSAQEIRPPFGAAFVRFLPYCP